MNDERFRAVVLEHKDRVHSYASWLLRDPEEAQDVTQETLVRLWDHRDRVKPEAARAWLLKTAYRLCIDRIRRGKSRNEVGGEDVLAPLPDPAAGPHRRTRAGEISRAIAGALRRLGATDRTVILLREVQGMPYGEIAEVLGQPLGTVKARLHRARDRMRRELLGVGVRP